MANDEHGRSGERELKATHPEPRVIDLNKASREDLTGLPMVGPTRADKLISARPFKSWEEIEHVPGFDKGMVDDLRNGGAQIGFDGGSSRGAERKARAASAGKQQRSSQMPVQSMEELFEHGLKDIYFAEKQILEALPKVAQKVKSQTLKQAMQKHVEETRGQVSRLDQVFKNCDLEPGGEECPAIEGLVKEAEKMMEEIKDPDVLSAALLAGAQAVEHYEIARYGTLCAWARMLGYDDSVDLLEETLEEEKKTDKILTDIAMEEVNEKASA